MSEFVTTVLDIVGLVLAVVAAGLFLGPPAAVAVAALACLALSRQITLANRRR